MVVMTTLPASGDWTVDDLDALPDDGLRYELVDGVLLVSPAPRVLHQCAQARMLVALAGAAPAGVEVLAAPVDVMLSRTRSLQPDLVVYGRDQLRQAKATGLPLLCVEVLSPSTRATDLTLKRHVLEQAGVRSYWLVDPDVPSLTVLELVDGAYRETAAVTGDEAYDAVRPFAVRVVPSTLVR